MELHILTVLHRRKCPRYELSGSAVGPQNQFGHSGQKKNFLFKLGIEPCFLSHLVHSLVTV